VAGNRSLVKSSFGSLDQQSHHPTLAAEVLPALIDNDTSATRALDAEIVRAVAGSPPGDFASRLEERRTNSPEILSPLLEKFGKDDSKYDAKDIDQNDFPKFDEDGWNFLKHLTISRDQTEGSAFQGEQLAALEDRRNRLIGIEHIGIGQVGVVFALHYA
jgi:hypothetical protein